MPLVKRHKFTAECGVCRRKLVTLCMVHRRKYIFICLTAIIMLPLLLSAKSVTIRVIDKVENQPILGCPVVLPNSVDTKYIGVTDIYGEITLDVPDSGMFVELRPVGYNRAVINAVNDTTVFLDLDEELFQNPLWVVNGVAVDVYYPYIWNPGIYTLKHEVAKAIKILNEDDIKNVSLDKNDFWYMNFYYPGVCQITTNRCKIGIIVDGVLKKTVKHTPEVLINYARRKGFASKKIKIDEDDIVTAVAVNTSDIPACDTDVDKFLLITTTAQYRHISKTNFMPYQFDNGDDYVRCERYRIVDNEGKIGYANPQGYIVIEPKYAFGFPFENGKAKVTDTGQMKEVEGSNGENHYWDSNDWYYIDQMGNRTAKNEAVQ